MKGMKNCRRRIRAALAKTRRLQEEAQREGKSLDHEEHEGNEERQEQT